MGFPMTIERVIRRNRLDATNASLRDDLKRLAEDAVTLALPTAERLAEMLHYLDGAQHFVRWEPADGFGSDEPYEVIECPVGTEGHLEDAVVLLEEIKKHGEA